MDYLVDAFGSREITAITNAGALLGILAVLSRWVFRQLVSATSSVSQIMSRSERRRLVGNMKRLKMMQIKESPVAASLADFAAKLSFGSFLLFGSVVYSRLGSHSVALYGQKPFLDLAEFIIASLWLAGGVYLTYNSLLRLWEDMEMLSEPKAYLERSWARIRELR